MDIGGCINVEEEKSQIYETDNVSIVMKEGNEPLNCDEDGNIYIGDNPRILGIFISSKNPALDKILELIENYDDTKINFNIEDMNVYFTPDLPDYNRPNLP